MKTPIHAQDVPGRPFACEAPNEQVAGEAVVIQDKTFNLGQICGGLLFGLGWALTGACPGPLFAQIGAGHGAAGVTLLSAIEGVSKGSKGSKSHFLLARRLQRCWDDSTRRASWLRG